MAEREQGHRHSLEDSSIKHEMWFEWGGLSAAFGIAIASLLTGAWLVNQGNTITGWTIGVGTPAIMLIKQFLKRSK